MIALSSVLYKNFKIPKLECIKVYQIKVYCSLFKIKPKLVKEMSNLGTRHKCNRKK